MASITFTIPEEYRDKLEEVQVTDDRSDEEILETFRHIAPITSEKNVWAFWDKGLDCASAHTRRNVCDWVRMLGPDWTVRVLDTVPDSPNNALKWVPQDMLPEVFLKDCFEGSWAGPHAADCLRGALLYLYGGVFSDPSVILFMHLDRICWDELEDPDSPYEVVAMIANAQLIGNGFVGSRKGSPFIKLWHDLFVHLWRGGKTSVKGFQDHPLLRFVKYFPKVMPDGTPQWEWVVPMEDLLEYVTQSCCWVRLCMLEDAGNGFNGTEYWMNKVLCFNYTDEALPGEQAVGYVGTGHALYKLLSLPVDAPDEVKASDDYKKAHDMVWGMLSDYAMQKLSHMKDINESVQLAVLWKENPGMDSKPGTFAHLIRYGSVHFRQKRASMKYREPAPPRISVKRGLLEHPPDGQPI